MATAATTIDLDVDFLTIPAGMLNDDVSLSITEAKKPVRKKKNNKNDKAKATPSKGFPLLNLNPEMLMTVMDNLPVVDNACLALSCKFLASIVTHHNALTVKASEAILGPNSHLATIDPYSEITGFFQRLQRGWIPRTGPNALKYCKRCSKFRPRNADFWLQYGMRKSVKFGGLTGRKWAQALKSRGNTIEAARSFIEWTITCPACYLENP